MKNTNSNFVSFALAALALTLPVCSANAETPVQTSREIAMQRAQQAISTAERQICATTTYLVWSVEAHRRHPNVTIDEEALAKAAELGPCSNRQASSNVRFHILKASYKLNDMIVVEDGYTPQIFAITDEVQTTVRTNLCHSLADIYGKQFNGSSAGAFLNQSILKPYFDKACSTQGRGDNPNDDGATREETLEFLLERLAPIPDKKATRSGESLLVNDLMPLVG
ncbi:MAG: hypothetical protein EOM37_08555 [Proteobacteria bacterium]|jgi:hypothetical protein|nr:hypothetical protein [Alphaproteobacteria bacterium]NCC04077.1 hypothetical protein [Pseudomonadota bacterium]